MDQERDRPRTRVVGELAVVLPNVGRGGVDVFHVGDGEIRIVDRQRSVHEPVHPRRHEIVIASAGDPRQPAFGEDRPALHHPGRHRREALLKDVGVFVDSAKHRVGDLIPFEVPLMHVDEDEFGLGLLKLLDPREIGF